MIDNKTLLLAWKEGGQTMAGKVALTGVTKVDNIQEEVPVGPFLVQARLVNPLVPESSLDIEMYAAITNEEIHVFMDEFPVVAQFQPELNNQFEKVLGFYEGERETENCLSLQGLMPPSVVGKGSAFYFSFNRSNSSHTSCMWDDETKKALSVPFYNFHGNGTSCLGNSICQPDDSPFKKLINFLNTYTTPHPTYEGDYPFLARIKADEKTKEKIKKAKTYKEMAKLVKTNSVWAEVYYEGSVSNLCQYPIGAIVPPECLRNKKKRMDTIGILTPTVG